MGEIVEKLSKQIKDSMQIDIQGWIGICDNELNNLARAIQSSKMSYDARAYLEQSVQNLSQSINENIIRSLFSRETKASEIGIEDDTLITQLESQIDKYERLKDIEDRINNQQLQQEADITNIMIESYVKLNLIGEQLRKKAINYDITLVDESSGETNIYTGIFSLNELVGMMRVTGQENPTLGFDVRKTSPKSILSRLRNNSKLAWAKEQVENYKNFIQQLRANERQESTRIWTTKNKKVTQHSKKIFYNKGNAMEAYKNVSDFIFKKRSNHRQAEKVFEILKQTVQNVGSFLTGGDISGEEIDTQVKTITLTKKGVSSASITNLNSLHNQWYIFKNNLIELSQSDPKIKLSEIPEANIMTEAGKKAIDKLKKQFGLG